MKNLISVFILFLISFTACNTIKPAANKSPDKKKSAQSTSENKPDGFDFSEQSTWLMGILTPSQLAREPYSEWYLKGFDDYQFNSEAINKLFEINKDDLSIKIIMGTWCPDSRREVPRFMRVLDIWQFPLTNVTVLGVDKEKQCPIGDFDKLNIQLVPTFILYKNNVEAGRIIENPVTSLEQDIVNILTKKE